VILYQYKVLPSAISNSLNLTIKRLHQLVVVRVLNAPCPARRVSLFYVATRTVHIFPAGSTAVHIREFVFIELTKRAQGCPRGVKTIKTSSIVRVNWRMSSLVFEEMMPRSIILHTARHNRPSALGPGSALDTFAVLERFVKTQ